LAQQAAVSAELPLRVAQRSASAALFGPLK
jgi:hypothetical protein